MSPAPGRPPRRGCRPGFGRPPPACGTPASTRHAAPASGAVAIPRSGPPAPSRPRWSARSTSGRWRVTAEPAAWRPAARWPRPRRGRRASQRPTACPRRSTTPQPRRQTRCCTRRLVRPRRLPRRVRATPRQRVIPVGWEFLVTRRRRRSHQRLRPASPRLGNPGRGRPWPLPGPRAGCGRPRRHPARWSTAGRAP